MSLGAPRTLPGDDFSQSEIAAWYADEAEGYYSLWAEDAAGDQYPYHLVNGTYGFARLPAPPTNALALGGGNGEDLLPVAETLTQAVVIEASSSYVESILPIEPLRVKAAPSGDLPFDDESFDLITSFSVLHHIPNVSHVLSELNRCLRPGGILLLREPTHWMGDSSSPRPGLTMRERGLPVRFLEDRFKAEGLEIRYRKRFFFRGSSRVAGLLGIPPTFSDSRFVALDRVLSFFFAWNYADEPRRWYDRFQPLAVFYVLEKPAPPAREG